MNNAEALDILRGAILVAVKLSAPVLILSMVIGILISILQAATQIHEQTLPKLVAIVVVFLLTGSWMLTTLQEYTVEIFSRM